MNLLPPAIQAALLRGQTGFPGGGGLPSSTQELSLQFSNLAQALAASGPGAGRSRYRSPASLAEPQQTSEALPGAVQSLLPQFLQDQSPVQGAYGVLPQSVNNLLPVYLRPRALEGSLMAPEKSLPEPINGEEMVRSGNEIIRQRNASGRNGFLEGELAEPTGPEGEGIVDYERGEFQAGEPLPEGIRRLLGAMPPPE